MKPETKNRRSFLLTAGAAAAMVALPRAARATVEVYSKSEIDAIVAAIPGAGAGTPIGRTLARFAAIGAPATITDPFGGTVSTAGTTTRGMQELVSFTYANGFPAEVSGLGPADPITLPDVLQFPGGANIAMSFRGTCFASASANGMFLFDTQQDCDMDFSGASFQYSAAGGSAIKFRPSATVQGVKWSQGNTFRFGQLKGTGGNPSSLLSVDVTGAVNGSQTLTSCFLLNRIVTGGIMGGGFVDYPIRFGTPSSALQVATQNTLDCLTVHDAKVAEILIGSFGATTLENGLGYNTLLGAISHTAAAPGGYCMYNGSPGWQCHLRSANIYASGPLFNFGFNSNAVHNRIYCKQVIGGASGPKQDSGTDNVIL